MACEGYFKLLPPPKGKYRIISVGPEYAEIDQKGMLHTVSIERLTGAAKEQRPNVEVMSKSKKNTNTNFAQEASIKNEMNHYAVEKTARHETAPRGTCYTVRRYGYKPQDDTIEQAEQFRNHFRRAN